MKDLFGDTVSSADSQLLTITPTSGKTTLSKAQKAFNTLIKQIDSRRATLAAWELAIPAYQKKHSEKLVPLQAEFSAAQRVMVLKLDGAYALPGLTKTEKGIISELITHIGATLLQEKSDDAELKAIYNQHNHGDYDADTAADSAMMKALLEDEFGIELGDDFDIVNTSPEEMLRRVHEQIQNVQEQDAQRQESRKKSAKQLAKEEKQAVEEKEVSQSIREVFRKLASALHPDREPDPAERERKTALMQRANSAYDSRNLLQLLELQLELEHIDQAHLANLSEARLKHYNKILKEQLNELDVEITSVTAAFSLRFHFDAHGVVPAALTNFLEIDIVRMRESLAGVNADMVVFSDKKRLKAWLKEMRAMLQSAHRDAHDFDDMAVFDDLF